MKHGIGSRVPNLLAGTTIILLCGSLAVASQVRPLNLEEMTERAATIFSGRCVGVTGQFDPVIGLNVTVATFEVYHVVKGEIGATVTVKFLGSLDSAVATRRSIAGLPSFRKDEEVVLFLYGESALGLTSPVGWSQGKFAVVRDKEGRKIAVNGFANRGLFLGVSDEADETLGGTLHQWEGRRIVAASALLDMVSALQE